MQGFYLNVKRCLRAFTLCFPTMSNHNHSRNQKNGAVSYLVYAPQASLSLTQSWNLLYPTLVADAKFGTVTAQ